ncbi:NAD(P)-dependent alcohol dehydrogenase [Undibacterium sp. Xuan67W]|uniref:NAD(P)-dependent alcohol dehydrogenase n=1 Tax=Undibacterium sp. Xuan67W TaxID=3413057 RepID=UPI003BF2A8AB
MKRLEYTRYGGHELVRMSEFSLPELKANEVLVRVAAASINPMDWKIRSGKMKLFTGNKFPRALGTDFAGTVESVGVNVDDFTPGDNVVGTVPMKGSGAFAPMLITSKNLIVKKPENLSFTEAATLPIAGVTAWHALIKKARLKPGQKIFLNGALGAVGQAAIAIAQSIGAEITARVGPHSLEQAQSLGINVVLDYTKPVPSSLDSGFDLVFDCNGSLSTQDAARLMKRGGMIIDIAPTRAKFFKACLSRANKLVFADPKAEYLQEVIALAAAGKLAIHIAQSISLAEAPEALALLERGERRNGKTVIVF